MSSSQEETPKKRSPWPWAIAIGLGIVFAANGTMFYLASTHRPVMETDDYYSKAVAHQTVIDARAASAKLGFTAEITGDGQQITYRLKDAKGAPVTGLHGEVTFRRNETNTLDQSAPITAGATPGSYTVKPPSAKAGLWRLEAKLEGGAAPWLDEHTVVF